MWLDATICAVVSNKVLALLPTAAELPFTDINSALLPAMNGVAIDVPERMANTPKGTGNVERIFPPGAATAGLKNMSFVGPYDVNDDISPPEVSGKLKSPPIWGKEIVIGAFATNCDTS